MLSFTFIVFSMLIWWPILTTQHRLTTSKARSHCVRRKLVLGTRRKWPRPRRLPPETETLTVFLKTRPRRDVGTSRDRDVETETTTLPSSRKDGLISTFLFDVWTQLRCRSSDRRRRNCFSLPDPCSGHWKRSDLKHRFRTERTTSELR